MTGRRVSYPILIFCCLTMNICTSASAEDVFLFSRQLSGVYLVKGDSEERVLYRQGAHIAPRLSPDGQKILFHSTQGGKIGVWVTDLQGKEKERICDGEQANWSPDGEKIVFSRDQGIMERDMAAGKEKRITSKPDSAQFPGYLADGRVLFVLSRQEIYRVDPNDEATPELIARGSLIKSAPGCSPDGKRIAYQDGAHIYLMDLADGNIRQLTTAGGVQSWPMWSQDGRSICYCQSSEDPGGTQDIYNISIESPENASLVTRDVEAGYDWHGFAPSASDTVELKGSKLNLWQIEGTLQDRGSWKSLSEGAECSELVIENDWGIYYLSAKAGRLLLLSGEMQEIMELGALDKQGNTAAAESVRILSSGGDNVLVDVAGVPFTISRTRPLVEIGSSGGIDRVYVKRKMPLALLPDRFSDDLIFVPDEYSTSRILLPRTPFLAGLPVGGVVLVIAPSDEQRIWLIKGESRDFFEGMEISAGEKSVFVSFLPDERLWTKTNLIPEIGANQWKMEWSEPFPAQWRSAIAGRGEYQSRMWNEEDISRLGGSALPIETGFPELSIIYLYGRSLNTPLDVITPFDILQDALGIELASVLDIEGIRGYRTADPPVPIHILLTSQENRLWPEGSPGWPQTLDLSPFHSLLVRVRMVNREGVAAAASHLCGDIIGLLDGLDKRMEEYERALDGLEKLCAVEGEPGVEADNFLDAVNKDIKRLRVNLTRPSITGTEEVAEAAEVVKGCLGSSEMLWDSDEFSRFWDLSGSALSEKQRILMKCRDFIKKVRNDAGMLVTTDPEASAAAEEIRNFTRLVLRDRYYLEGDWRGEKPL